MEWITVREAADMTKRSESTIRGWIAKAKELGLTVEKGGFKWHIEKESLNNLSVSSKRLNTNPIETEEELLSVRCPECEGDNWRKRDYKKLKRGGVSLRFCCNDKSCDKKWSLRAVSDSEILNNLQEKKVVARKKRIDMPFGGGDTKEKVESDRKKYVKGYVKKGLKLSKIQEIFSQELHEEIRGYYCQEKRKLIESVEAY